MKLPKLAETEDYTFDEAAADRPIRFIERYCRHYEGRFAGQPFLLQPIQKQIIRDIYGWKWKPGRGGERSGFRRFTDVYFEAAVGAGKSPLLAALGLYGLMADGETGAQVYSLAATFSQARIVFDCAKRFVQAHPDLARRLQVRQAEIRHPRSGSFWRIVPGKGPGAGCRPSMVLGDEVHDWKNSVGYDALRSRFNKRDQPLMINATNAGQSRASFCWRQREKAVAALDGTGDPAIYAIIWHAAEDAKSDDPAAWRAANPLLGITVREEKVRADCVEAMKDPEEEKGFRRLYLSIWPQGGLGRWLDMVHWDGCAQDDAPPAGSAIYVGLDLSLGDDLCAAAYVYATPDRFYVRPEFWVPKETADRYIKRDGIPYDEWSDDGHIHLLSELTISAAVRSRIAQQIVEVGKTGEIKAVCYDRARAEDTVAALEAAGLTCLPIPQGYTLAPGCHELDRRLKERSIVVSSNPVLRWNAENTEVFEDQRGNIWPVKPNAKGKYAGTRSAKIDGITALVTALTEARKHSFPAAKKQWKGKICLA